MDESFDITYTDLNPTLLFAGKRAVLSSNSIHTHDSPELIIVLYGNVVININGTTFPLKMGDIICIPAHIPHNTIMTSSIDPAIIFFTSFSDFQFKDMEPDSITFPGGQYYMHTSGLVFQDITTICLQMVAERYSNQIGQYFMQKAYLTQLLLLIIRQIMTPPDRLSAAIPFKTHSRSYVVSEIRKYLSLHYAEKISLDLIAKNMYLSSAYISRAFREETGEAPINYLIRTRLEHARLQLEANDHSSLKEIAENVGYDDVYYFSKLFKKYYGISPMNYRASARKVTAK